MSLSMGRLGWLLGVSLAAYVGVCLLAFLFQRNLLYFPIRWNEQEADRANPGFEEVRIATSDGERLHAWLQRLDNSPWTVVIFHGNAGNLYYHQATMYPFRKLGLQAILFDYRSYGLSSGHPTQKGLLLDGEAVVNYVEKTLGVPGEQIVYFGQSLGSGVAVLLAEKRPPARLILESGFTSLARVASTHYPFLPAGLLLRDRFEAARAIRSISCPVLFLHPSLDEIIPMPLGRALFKAANEPKRFVELPGAHHNDSFEVALAEQVEAIGDFLQVDAQDASQEGN
ncbi:MAG: alpha/beta hydrolase [Acidobacteria bacterium]|nr:alpha/beta hydrolase [Acidobacteriota bacterium]